MENKYLNEAIIGNKKMIATYTAKGELQRVYFPSKDNRQYINYFHTGVKVNESDLIYLHDDINNIYKQYYDTDTNILNTEITNTYFNLKIVQTDYILIKQNILAKKYIFINEGKIDLDTEFYIHSELLSDTNNFVGCKIIDGGMMQYAHDFSFSTFAKGKDIIKHQINGSSNNIKRTDIYDKDYIGMSKDSSIAYKIGIIKPGEKQELQICVSIDENKNISDIEDEIERSKRIDFEKEYIDTKAYWRKYVKNHNGLKMKEADNSYEERIYEIYKRSILLFPLLTNPETGAIIASPEIDEGFTKCGRYAYCWPRDAVFITKAMDILNMNKEIERFYKVFCKKVQSKNGMFEQRFYTDGNLAPCWGYQIDETASVVYGVYEHYKYCKNEKFLKENLQMCEKAVDFLKRYINDILEETNKYHVSYDLWEMNEGKHLYSFASIYSAFDCMLRIYDILGNDVSDFEKNRLKEEKIYKSKKEIEKLQVEIKKYVNTNMYENDHYMNGNPWPIATLWMTLYYLETGEKKKAKETFDFVVKTVGKHNFLGEQVDNETLKPNWVIGLGWSHAMFIIVLEKLYGNNIN